MRTLSVLQQVGAPSSLSTEPRFETAGLQMPGEQTHIVCGNECWASTALGCRPSDITRPRSCTVKGHTASLPAHSHSGIPWGFTTICRPELLRLCLRRIISRVH